MAYSDRALQFLFAKNLGFSIHLSVSPLLQFIEKSYDESRMPKAAKQHNKTLFDTRCDMHVSGTPSCFLSFQGFLLGIVLWQLSQGRSNAMAESFRVCNIFVVFRM